MKFLATRAFEVRRQGKVIESGLMYEDRDMTLRELVMEYRDDQFKRVKGCPWSISAGTVDCDGNSRVYLLFVAFVPPSTASLEQRVARMELRVEQLEGASDAESYREWLCALRDLESAQEALRRLNEICEGVI